jgi:acetyl-CoA carboxylase biotin carboxyl carrier protein
MAMSEVLAEMDGTIIELTVATGDEIAEGDTVMVMESMKMEVPACAPCAGRIGRIRVAVGDVVNAGAVLATVDR